MAARVVDVQSMPGGGGTSVGFDDLRSLEPREGSARAPFDKLKPLGAVGSRKSPEVDSVRAFLLDGLEGSVAALEALGPGRASGDDDGGGASARRRERCADLSARLAVLGRAMPDREPRVSFNWSGVQPESDNGGNKSAIASPRSAFGLGSGGAAASYAAAAADAADAGDGGDAGSASSGDASGGAPKPGAFPVSIRPRTPTREERRRAHRAALVKRFLDMDYDGDGEITITEFANFMSSDGISYKEAKALFNSVDENGDGTMDQMEFITLMESKHPSSRRCRGPWRSGRASARARPTTKSCGWTRSRARGSC